jgi:hypothetical protein
MKVSIGLVMILCQIIGLSRLILAAESKASWQAEWDQTVRAAEQEGQVMVSIGGYGAIIDSGVFQKSYPKIKITHMTGAGTDLTQRISAERRAGKYLVDVYNGGGNSLFQILYQGKMLDPIKSALILPEVTDATKWWEGKQKYADRESQYIFVYEGNVSAGGARLTTPNCSIRASTRATGICSIPNLREGSFPPIFAKCAGQVFPGSFCIINPSWGQNISAACSARWMSR